MQAAHEDFRVICVCRNFNNHSGCTDVNMLVRSSIIHKCVWLTDDRQTHT